MVETLFDVNCGMLGRKPGRTERLLPDALLKSLESCRITGALVRALPADSEADHQLSNRLLYEACAAHDELHPCPVVVPAVPGAEQNEAEQVEDALANGAPAVWIRPAQDYWPVRVWSAGPLFGTLQDHRLPVLLAGGAVDLTVVHEIAAAYNRLPFIITGAGYRELRGIMPLLHDHQNLYLAVGTPFSVHCGLEYLVRYVGADRLLFGSGLPSADPAAAAAQLAWADISDEDCRLIGTENFASLAEGIVP